VALHYPANFIADLEGRNTNLIPVVVIRLDDPIYISTNSCTIDGNSVKPILEKIPTQKESIDVDKRQFRQSSMTLQLSNYAFEGVRFSELVKESSLVNIGVDIYWVSPSFFNTTYTVDVGDLDGDGVFTENDLMLFQDCILAENCAELYGDVADIDGDGDYDTNDLSVFTAQYNSGGELGADAFGTASVRENININAAHIFKGIIMRYEHDVDKVKIVIEDKSQEKINSDSWQELQPITNDIPDRYKNTPKPLVYGVVDKSPCAIISNPQYIDSATEENQIKIMADKSVLTVVDGNAENQIFIFNEHYLPISMTSEEANSGNGAFGYDIFTQYSASYNIITIGYSTSATGYGDDEDGEGNEQQPVPLVHPLAENRIICNEILYPSSIVSKRDTNPWVWQGVWVFKTTNTHISQDSNDPLVGSVLAHYSGTLFWENGGPGDLYLTATNLWPNNNDLELTGLGTDYPNDTIQEYRSEVGTFIKFPVATSGFANEYGLLYMEDKVYGHSWSSFYNDSQIQIKCGKDTGVNADGIDWRCKTSQALSVLSGATQENPTEIAMAEGTLGNHGSYSNWWTHPIRITYDPGEVMTRFVHQYRDYYMGVEHEIIQTKLDHYMLIDDASDKDYYAYATGNQSTKPSLLNVVNHIVAAELGEHTDYDLLETQEYDYWNYAFTISEKINGKKLIAGISAASPFFPRFDSKGHFTYTHIKKSYIAPFYNATADYNVEAVSPNHLIKEEDCINFTFGRTSLDSVFTKIEFLYNWDYAREEFSGRRSLSVQNFVCEDLNEDGIYQGYDWGYYGFLDNNNSTSTLVIDDDRGKYIRDNETAERYVTWMLSWHMNQHLKLDKVRLPLKYMNIEVGDIIRFDKLLSGVKPYGIDYTTNDTSIAQYQIFEPYFMVYSTSKRLDYIELSCIQMHTLWDAKAVEDGGVTETGDIVDLEANNVEPGRGGRGSTTGCASLIGCKSQNPDNCNNNCLSSVPEGSQWSDTYGLGIGEWPKEGERGCNEDDPHYIEHSAGTCRTHNGVSYYYDADGDGYGDPENQETFCTDAEAESAGYSKESFSDCPEELEDCAGECGGNAYFDDCGVCDDDPYNDCVQDCAGEWGGSAEIDECGVCDGSGADADGCCADDSPYCQDGSISNCGAADCAGTCGGGAIEYEPNVYELNWPDGSVHNGCCPPPPEGSLLPDLIDDCGICDPCSNPGETPGDEGTFDCGYANSNCEASATYQPNHIYLLHMFNDLWGRFTAGFQHMNENDANDFLDYEGNNFNIMTDAVNPLVPLGFGPRPLIQCWNLPDDATCEGTNYIMTDFSGTAYNASEIWIHYDTANWDWHWGNPDAGYPQEFPVKVNVSGTIKITRTASFDDHGTYPAGDPDQYTIDPWNKNVNYDSLGGTTYCNQIIYDGTGEFNGDVTQTGSHLILRSGTLRYEQDFTGTLHFLGDGGGAGGYINESLLFKDAEFDQDNVSYRIPFVGDQRFRVDFVVEVTIDHSSLRVDTNQDNVPDNLFGEGLLGSYVMNEGTALSAYEVELENYPPSECNANPGDINGDGVVNVSDIVILANCVLVESCAGLDNSCAGDINCTGSWNVQDIVITVNCILAENCHTIDSC
tara:strand:+ start:2836 stop:7641 length:4806 start_codon:yes stop_codon:yes gene_type:complete